MTKRKVIVIGGAGSFGFRLAEGLCATTDLAVSIAGRDLERAKSAAAKLTALHPGRDVEAARLDTASVTDASFRDLGAWLVVDAAGPFQNAAPRVARAAIEAGCHYVDIADARDFVAEFPALDAEARRAKILAVTGASSTPCLNQAVLDELVRGWNRIDTIEIALSPGNRQPRGQSVVQAILARAGQKVRVFRNGAWSHVSGMSLLVRRRIPGLGHRWLFLVDTPDLDLTPQRFAPRRDAIFRAGLELGFLHLGIWALSRLVAIGLLRTLLPLAGALRWIADRFRAFGCGRGGMMITAEGIDPNGRGTIAVWALIAHEDDGPYIPVLPALALIRALANDRIAQTGAMPCVGLLSLADIAREFARFRIVTRTMVRPRSLIARALGSSFAAMPEPIRRGHLVNERLVFEGRGSVDCASNVLGRVVLKAFGFPPACSDVPVRVEMIADRDGEIWRRTFGARTFKSRLSPARGPGRILERFGPITFRLDLCAGPEGLDLIVSGARLGWLPIPRRLLPRSHATERIDNEGRFYFDVPVTLPGIGLLIHYRGWLVPNNVPGECARPP